MDNSRCGRLQFSKRPPICSTRIVISCSSYCPHATGESRGAEGSGGQLEVSAYPDGAWEEPWLQRLVEFRAAGTPPDLGVSGQEEIPWMHLPISALSPTGDHTGISSRRELMPLTLRFLPRQHHAALQGQLSIPQPESGLTLCLRFSSACSVVSDSLWPQGLRHSRLPCLSLSLGLCSNSCGRHSDSLGEGSVPPDCPPTTLQPAG